MELSKTQREWISSHGDRKLEDVQIDETGRAYVEMYHPNIKNNKVYIDEKNK